LIYNNFSGCTYPPVVSVCSPHAEVPFAEKKAPSALSLGQRRAKGADRGQSRLPPPGILRMLLDTMRGLPRGRGAGDHGLRQAPSPARRVCFTAADTARSLGACLAFSPGGRWSNTTRLAASASGTKSARVREQCLIVACGSVTMGAGVYSQPMPCVGTRGIVYFIPSRVNKQSCNFNIYN